MEEQGNTVYGIINYVSDACVFFNAKQDLADYLYGHEREVFETVFSVSFIGEFEDKSNVIRVYNIDSDIITYMTMLDEETYVIYNEQKNTWEYECGSIQEYYDALSQNKRKIG